MQQLDAQNLNASELELATSLVEQLATTLPEIDTQDNYFNALRTLINSKIKGTKVADFEEVDEVPKLDLMSALKKSLEASSRKDQSGTGTTDAAPDSRTLTLVPSSSTARTRKKKTA